MTDSELSSAGGEITPELLKKAYKAFKKRLKLAQLDDSSVAGGALSSGGGGLTAVRPPDNYPPAVWSELVHQGRLKDAGYGLYELPESASPKGKAHR